MSIRENGRTAKVQFKIKSRPTKSFANVKIMTKLAVIILISYSLYSLPLLASSYDIIHDYRTDISNGYTGYQPHRNENSLQIQQRQVS